MEEHREYIGDGVYVSFDGYNVNIAVNNHENHVVALEPQVQESLIAYIFKIKKLISETDS